MRRADYLTLAAICARHRAEMAIAVINASTDEQEAIATARARQVEDIARDFARGAHLGGLSADAFLRAAGVIL